jgi:hypothetical protein
MEESETKSEDQISESELVPFVLVVVEIQSPAIEIKLTLG